MQSKIHQHTRLAHKCKFPSRRMQRFMCFKPGLVFAFGKLIAAGEGGSPGLPIATWIVSSCS